jgi:hypothetical protein
MKKIVSLPKEEYKVLDHYAQNRSLSKIGSAFYALYTNISNDIWYYMDISYFREALDQDFDYLILRKRYEFLLTQFPKTLSYDENGFLLDGHRFETLDEVEKAINNKAFL